MASQWPPRKNAACTVRFPIYGYNQLPQTGVAGLDSEVSQNGGAFADCTNEATEIGTTGVYSLLLTAAEMNTDRVTIQIKTTSYGTTVITIDTIGLNDVSTVVPLPADVSFSTG